MGNQGGQFNTNSSLGATLTHVFSPSIVNVARFGFTDTNANFTNASVNGGGAAAYGFSFPSTAINPASGGLPLINPSNYNELGTRGFRPQYQKPTLYQFIDSFSWIKGTHSMRAGFETRQKSNTNFNVSRTVPEYDFNGNFTGEAMADLLMGQVYNFVADTQEIETILQKCYAVYFQDDWKVTPKLTVNMGLRWEYETPYLRRRDPTRTSTSISRPVNWSTATAHDYVVTPDHRGFRSPRWAWPTRSSPRSSCFAAAGASSIRAKTPRVRISTWRPIRPISFPST